MKQIFTSLLFTCLVYGQFGNVKVVFDNDLLKAYEQQNVLPLKLDIANFIQSTRWDEEYSDLKIPLHIQFIFEGVAQKGAQETYMAQVLFSNGTDQRFFDKSFFKRIPVTSIESELAADFIREHNLEACDAIIAATACEHDAVVLFSRDGDKKRRKNQPSLLKCDGLLGSTPLQIKVPDAAAYTGATLFAMPSP